MIDWSNNPIGTSASCSQLHSNVGHIYLLFGRHILQEDSSSAVRDTAWLGFWQNRLTIVQAARQK